MQSSQGKDEWACNTYPTAFTRVWHVLLIIRRYTFNHSNTVSATWNLQKPFQRYISSWENWWSYFCINLLNCKNHKVMVGRHGSVPWWYHYHVWSLMNLWWHPWNFHDFYLSKIKLFPCLVLNKFFIIYLDVFQWIWKFYKIGKWVKSILF